jgi:hypothetical protein
VTDLPKPPADAPRSWHEWYAHAYGWFWLPCPLCAEYFGGHEWVHGPGIVSSIPAPEDGPGVSVGICPACTEAGKGVPTATFVNCSAAEVERDG